MAISELHGDVRTEEFLLNMGPQHPSTHGVLRVVIRTDGEIVLEAVSHVGYLHRCFEKCAENVTYKQIIPYTDRMDYLAAMHSNVGFSLGAERLLEWEELIPRRTKIIRVILCELQRIASHLMSIGTYGLDLGAITLFLHCFRERERILDLFEEICGQRLNYSYVIPGGLTYPWPDTINAKIRDFCVYFEERINEYNQLLSTNGIFVGRTRDIGVVPADLAIAYGCTGPMLRGSGVRRDLRFDQPYLIYDELVENRVFKMIVAGDQSYGFDWNVGVLGDCWSRYMIRALELEESRLTVLHCLDLLAREPVDHFDLIKEARRAYKAKKDREVYFCVENPRGELGYYIVSDGKANPYRVRARGPSFNNLSILTDISKGSMVADLCAIIGSIDIVLGEVDR
jgi:NADH-quinone oxidoreductase subunit D